MMKWTSGKLDGRDEDHRHAEDQVEDPRIDARYKLREERDRDADRDDVAPRPTHRLDRRAEAGAEGLEDVRDDDGQDDDGHGERRLHDHREAGHHDERHREAHGALDEAREQGDGDGHRPDLERQMRHCAPFPGGRV
jgi:hypothetical protein